MSTHVCIYIYMYIHTHVHIGALRRRAHPDGGLLRRGRALRRRLPRPDRVGLHVEYTMI